MNIEEFKTICQLEFLNLNFDFEKLTFQEGFKAISEDIYLFDDAIVFRLMIELAENDCTLKAFIDIDGYAYTSYCIKQSNIKDIKLFFNQLKTDLKSDLNKLINIL